MKERIKPFIGLISVLIILGVVVLLVNAFTLIINPKTYGNTEDEIIKAIYKTEQVNKEQEEIEIVEIMDMGTTRVAGFCTSIGKTGIIEFKKDKKEKYVYTYAETQTGEIGNYVQWFNDAYPESASKKEEHVNGGGVIDKSARLVFIVIGNGKEKYDVSLNVNKAYDFNGELPVGKLAMLKFAMPEVTADGYTFNLKVIDAQGNDIIRNN